MVVGQNLRYLFGVGYHPTLVFFKGFLGVHRGTGVLTHCHMFFFFLNQQHKDQIQLPTVDDLLAFEFPILPAIWSFAFTFCFFLHQKNTWQKKQKNALESGTKSSEIKKKPTARPHA